VDFGVGFSRHSVNSVVCLNKFFLVWGYYRTLRVREEIFA
jgi:hypothetical protein